MEGIIVLQRDQLEEIMVRALTKFFAQRDEEQATAEESSQDYTYLGRGEVCERYHVSKGTLNNWVNRGLIQPIKLGRRVLFPLSELMRAEANGLTKYRRA